MATNDELGGAHDTIGLKLGGVDIKIAESYEVKVSILQQPSAFSIRLGSDGTAADLLSMAAPGTPFELSIITGGTPRIVSSGLVDARGVPSGQYTQVEIRGRDYLAQLFDSYVIEEQSFPQKTFYELTRAVMDQVGLTTDKGHFLQSINDINRQLLTGVHVDARSSTEIGAELFTGSMTGTGELVYRTMKAQLGVRYYDFLQQQFKLAGLFLWASPDKTFVLSRPSALQPASFNLFRSRSGERSSTGLSTNIIDCRFNDDTAMRHTQATVYGRSGGGRKGVEICRGTFVDDEMFNYSDANLPPGAAPGSGYIKNVVVHDADVKSQAECEYVARRMLSDERRAGWQLEYTVAGHQVPSVNSATGTANWGPDTVVRVDDIELHHPSDPSLNFKKNFYIEAVTYSSNPQKTTKLTLMRPGDLLFATSLQEDGELIKRKQNPHFGKTIR